MAIIVNKEEKRANIAMACTNILLEKGIKNITISELAKAANVGKGTIYEYFSNKEDIVYEIIRQFIDIYKSELLELLKKQTSTKDKLFYYMYKMHNEKVHTDRVTIYRDFLAISVIAITDDMVKFNVECRETFLEILKDILQEGIDKGELKEDAINFASAISLFARGLFLDVDITKLDPKEEIETFLNVLFDSITTKEER